MGEVTVRVPRLRRVAGRYFWRPTPAVKKLGFRAQPLGPDFVRAVEAARRLNEQVERKLAGVEAGPAPGTIAALMLAYEREERFAGLAHNTRRQYLGIMREIARNAGDLAVADITRRDMKALYRSLRQRGTSIAAAHMRLWRILLGYAVDEGLRADNPATKLNVAAGRARTQTWTPAEVATFCVAAEAVGRPSIALAVRLAYEAGQRVSDVLRASWRDLEGGALRVVQQKTGAKVTVPLSAGLLADLERMERRAVTIVAHDGSGQPWGDYAFRAQFNRIRAKAGLRHLRFHDLRRTALTEAGAGGATVVELRALGGHADLSSLQRYVVPTADAARGAQDKRGTKWQK